MWRLAIRNVRNIKRNVNYFCSGVCFRKSGNWRIILSVNYLLTASCRCTILIRIISGRTTNKYLPLQTPHQIHKQTRCVLLAFSFHKGTEFPSNSLSDKKSTHHKNIGVPCKTNGSKQTQGNDEGNRNMYCQHPLQWEFSHIDAPITKGDINYQYQ